MEAEFRVVVAGCGQIAGSWLPYTLDRRDAEIVALVDIDQKQAERVAGRFGLCCPIFSDIDAAIEAASPKLVYCLAPPEAHASLVTSALNRDCHVFTEKPLGTSMREARALVDLAQARTCNLSVMQNRRYDAGIRALRKLVADQAIGSTGIVAADFFMAPHFGGFRERMAHPLLLDMAIHTFDQLRFITGADATEALCEEFNTPGSWYSGDASAVCLFRLSDGSVFSYRGSWSADGYPTSWQSHWRIVGSAGTALWDGEHLPRVEVPDARSQTQETACRRVAVAGTGQDAGQGRVGHEGCLEEMYAALIAGRKAETDCADNINSLAMVFAALESARARRWIDVNALLAGASR